MNIIGPILRKYATATTIYFPLQRVSTDDIEDGPATLAAGDARFSEDGANFAATNGTIAHVDEGLYSLALLSTEVTGAVAHIRIEDQTSPKTFIDTLIIIETYGNASAQHAVDLDDNVRAGLTSLPNAAPDAAGGLPISDAGGLDLDNDVANALIAVGLDHLIANSGADTDVADDSLWAQLTDAGATADYSNYRPTEDSQRAISEKVGAIGTGFRMPPSSSFIPFMS